MVSVFVTCVTALLLNSVMAAFTPPSYDLPAAPALVVNTDLVDIEARFAQNGLAGLSVQTMVVQGSKMFVAALDGWVYVVENDNISPLASVSSDASCVVGYTGDLILCGQPTGMVMGPNGVDLYISDSFIGVIRIDSVTGARELVFAMGTAVGGVPTVFFEDIAVDNDGTLYVAEGSSKWSQAQLMSLLLESGNDGRVIEIKPNTGVSPAVVISGLRYCTSVLLEADGKSLLISELLEARVKRHYIKGVLKGTTTTFSDNLPGFPDNIRPSSSGGYWVAFPIVRDQSVFETIDSLPAFRSTMHEDLSPSQIEGIIVPARGMVAELDSSGQVVRTLQDLAAEKIAIVTEVNDNAGELHFGAFTVAGVARLED